MKEQDKEIIEKYKVLLEENQQLIIKNKALTEKIKMYEKEVSNPKKTELKNIHSALKDWLPKQKEKINYSLEYLNLISQKIEIEGIDSVGSRRKNKLSKVDYRFRIIKFYEEGLYQSENFMVYHAQLLSGGNDLEQLKAFVSKINRIKSKAATIGAYELSEQAEVLKLKGEEGDITAICKLLGGFIREYKKMIKNIGESLDLEPIDELLEDDNVESILLQPSMEQYDQLPRYIMLSEEKLKDNNEIIKESSNEITQENIEEGKSCNEERLHSEEIEEDENMTMLEETSQVEIEENIHEILEKLQEVKTALEELKMIP